MKRKKDIQFVFFCPNRHEVFETADFSLVDNKGVVTDADGNRYLDARVALDTPCPFCGERHVFHASELACPFETDIKKERDAHERD